MTPQGCAQAAKARFDAEEDFKKRAHLAVVALQARGGARAAVRLRI